METHGSFLETPTFWERTKVCSPVGMNDFQKPIMHFEEQEPALWKLPTAAATGRYGIARSTCNLDLASGELSKSGEK
jgi:hypothetical protein